MPTATASSKLLEPILQLASHYDAGSDSGEGQLQSQILTAASLTTADFTRPDARFPARNFTQVLSRLAEASGNPYITLRLAEATQPRMLGSVGFLISTAETLEQALHILVDYLPILFEGAELQLKQDSQDMLLQFTVAEEQQNVVEYFLACLLNWPRWLTGRQIPVSAVELAFPQPDNLTTYQQFFAAEVSFQACRHSLRLPSSYLALPCVDANREMHQLHKEFADALLSKTNQKTALTAQIRAIIRQQLISQSEAIRREQIAQQLGLSLRTLQRKLGELDTNFQTLYDQTRQELCLQLIQRGQLSFGEIAFQLGFSNQSAFQKAFKRWMGMAPSQYRQQLAPKTSTPLNNAPVNTALPQTPAPSALLKPTQPEPTQPEQQIDAPEQRAQALSRKLAKLNPFGLKTLYRAAVYGKCFNLRQLAKITADPLARLMIHIWPAEQEGLIQPLPNQQEPVEFCFTSTEIQHDLYQQLNSERRQKYHAQLGQVLVSELPEFPSLQPLGDALQHLNQGYQNPTTFYSDNQPEGLTSDAIKSEPSDSSQSSAQDIITPYRLYQLNNQASQLAQQQNQYALALDYLQLALTFLDQIGSSDQANNNECFVLLLQQGQLHLKLAQIEEAETCAQQLATENLTAHQQGQLSLFQARIYQYQNQQANALSVLLNQQSDLPREDKDQLVFLLHTLEQIQQQRQRSPQLQKTSQPQQTSKHEPLSERQKISEASLLQLAQLEQISMLAQQHAQPLLSACAISQMALHCLRLEPNDFSGFAFIGYAWVASWFCGDYNLAKHFLHLGQQEVRQQSGGENGSANPDPAFTSQELIGQILIDKHALSSISADLRHSSQIQHWLEPLPQVLKQLKKIAHVSQKAGDDLLHSEQCVLMQQVHLIASEQALSKTLQRCEKQYQQLLPQQPYSATQLKESSIQLIHYLQGKALLPNNASYANPWQASSLIQAALLLDQQTLWPELYHWQARLENELPGYFIISETLFCTSMMRLIQSQQEQQLSRRRQRVIEQIESRFELWAQHCPENFSGQLALLKAEKASLQQQLITADSYPTQTPGTASDTASLYEQALANLEQQSRPYHKALAYERYGHYLQVSQQPRLARFCHDEAKRLYQSWGASAKVKQLNECAP